MFKNVVTYSVNVCMFTERKRVTTLRATSFDLRPEPPVLRPHTPRTTAHFRRVALAGLTLPGFPFCAPGAAAAGGDGGELSYALWGHGGRARRLPDGPDARPRACGRPTRHCGDVRRPPEGGKRVLTAMYCTAFVALCTPGSSVTVRCLAAYTTSYPPDS